MRVLPWLSDRTKLKLRSGLLIKADFEQKNVQQSSVRGSSATDFPLSHLIFLYQTDGQASRLIFPCIASTREHVPVSAETNPIMKSDHLPHVINPVIEDHA